MTRLRIGSIRRTLLAYLLLGLLAVAVLATWLTYHETRREVGDLFDLQLKQLAYSTRIDDLIRGRAPSFDKQGARADPGVAEIVTQIWDRDGVLVYWSRPGTGLPVPAQEGYTNVTRDGREWRVYTHVAGAHALQVAHALDERQAIATQTALRTLAPLAALIPLLGVLIWYGVGLGLKPLTLMSRAVEKRRPDAMAPLAVNNMPLELKPLGQSLNALLARLDEALATQRRFTADAAHELRTPLAALKLQAELAQRTPEGPERSAAFAALGAGVDRATHLVEQLLTMARLEPGGPARDAQPVDLVAVVRDALVARAALAEDKGVDLGLVRADATVVRGDASSLAMLVGNLVDNAVRYTPAGGKVDVAIEHNDTGSTLSVVDTGPGIPVAERERVFERFYRITDAAASAKARGDTKGSGLGLSIVRRIAEAHGATVELADAGHAPGLAVRVRFPA